ncbi:stage V sporulation protein E [Candidatus Campbellbacteria bacterium CG22_combo_CG10-13_8_21_14_all_36_13]|uniref:Probable peptidoglycan glycosyltransferase FtsW n=1 Tax=Candidatus Campbellbacteria bacterium CG22_combo_CG10-13_8_21_14_all_36_13 TaxID=1974529 RepID=A0A2H0DXE1_9BACT|nr:MAG: stage V sporulation protein E [Candidatus Campbellbacteria bacterium CG22_combo_CG10-13_8_21_14_all_36_13]
MKKRGVDLTFLGLLTSLVLVGFIIFYSASLGLYAKEGITFSRTLFSQIFFGFIIGSTLLWITSRTPLAFWQKYAIHVFVFCASVTMLVFIPGIGIEHGGARRWLAVGSISFQPAELLKIGSVILFASWLAVIKQKVQSIKLGLIPVLGLMSVVSGILLLQKDTGTTMVIVATLIGMYFLAGAKIKHVIFIITVCLIGVYILSLVHPYIQSRIDTYLHPDRDPQGESYQIQQAFIAVGSGGLLGKGFGKSIQKFDFLPEPTGDSIFAIYSEEWGFVGSVVLLILFLLLTFRGFAIASKSQNLFTFYIVSGVVLLVISQSLINISAMIGVLPLTGMPLIFVSKGGSALSIALASMGIVLSASRSMKT